MDCDAGDCGNGGEKTVLEPVGEISSSLEPQSSESRLPPPGCSVAGIDGCRAGWVMVRRDEAGRFEKPIIAKTLDDLPSSDIVLVDILIGLPDSGRRECDQAARAKLVHLQSNNAVC